MEIQAEISVLISFTLLVISVLYHHASGYPFYFGIKIQHKKFMCSFMIKEMISHFQQLECVSF